MCPLQKNQFTIITYRLEKCLIVKKIDFLYPLNEPADVDPFMNNNDILDPIFPFLFAGQRNESKGTGYGRPDE